MPLASTLPGNRGAVGFHGWRPRRHPYCSRGSPGTADAPYYGFFDDLVFNVEGDTMTLEGAAGVFAVTNNLAVEGG